MSITGKTVNVAVCYTVLAIRLIDPNDRDTVIKTGTHKILLPNAGPVLELLDSTDLELRMLAMVTAANILSFSDSLLLTNKDCIDAFSECMEDLLDAIKRYVEVTLKLVFLTRTQHMSTLLYSGRLMNG